MTTALASLLTGRPVKHTVGMTGEVTLQGRVLPIGGLKQKVLAAHAAGLTDVILPERNRADLDDVPEDVREQMTFHPVMTIGEVLDVALEPAPAVRPRLTPSRRIPPRTKLLRGRSESRAAGPSGPAVSLAAGAGVPAARMLAAPGRIFVQRSPERASFASQTHKWLRLEHRPERWVVGAARQGRRPGIPWI